MSDQNKLQPDNKSMMDQVALVSFIDGLIKDRKDADITLSNMDNVKTILLKEVNTAINTHILSLLSAKDQVDLDDLLNKNGSDEELNKFFINKIPNLESEIASALLNFRAAYLYPVSQEVSQPPPPLPAPVPNTIDKKMN